MPKAKYDHIYRDLKEKIETEYYAYQEMLPSEHALVEEYGCSTAELDSETKNRISHRGNALRLCEERLRELL